MHRLTLYDPEYASPIQEECTCELGRDHTWAEYLTFLRVVIPDS